MQNDSRQERCRIGRWLVGLNAAGAVAAAAFAVVAVIDPGLLAQPGSVVSPAVRFYAQMYAVRALPVSAVLVVLLIGRRQALAPVLVVAGLVQAGDVLVGVARGVPSMIIGGGLLAVLHLATASRLVRASASARVSSVGAPSVRALSVGARSARVPFARAPFARAPFARDRQCSTGSAVEH